MRRWLALSGVMSLAWLASASHARAERQMSDMRWLLIGPVFASTTHEGEKGGLTVGGEGSLFLGANRFGLWSGGYLDVLHDPGRDQNRCTFGPEVGYSIVGVDGGVLLVGADELGAGLTARLFATLAFVGVYGRFGWSFLGVHQTHAEGGIFVKLPIPLSD